MSFYLKISQKIKLTTRQVKYSYILSFYKSSVVLCVTLTFCEHVIELREITILDVL